MANNSTAYCSVNTHTNMIPARNCRPDLGTPFPLQHSLNLGTLLNYPIKFFPHYTHSSQNWASLALKFEALAYIKPISFLVYQFNKFKILKVKFSLELRSIWFVLNEIKMTENKEKAFIKLGT